MRVRKPYPMAVRGLVMLLMAASFWAVVGAHPAAATGVPVASATASGRAWPLQPPPRVVSRFQAPAGPYAAGHRGVDLAASVGQPVLSTGAGVVAFAGLVAGRGVVSVDHPDGLRSTYEPVAGTVGRGDVVSGGERLGAVSAAPGHCLPDTCLHWGLRRGEAYLDPLGLLDAAGRVRLLPLWAVARPVHAAPAPPVRAELTRATPAPDRGPLLARG